MFSSCSLLEIWLAVKASICFLSSAIAVAAAFVSGYSIESTIALSLSFSVFNSLSALASSLILFLSAWSSCALILSLNPRFSSSVNLLRVSI
ncbi:hypothetical protein [Mycoplasmopsis edwardii]|uniref:Uncharacterized protein n=1 Tax=Mycoplasmopsis edwardii TaxID=53558 RepID=A0ACD4PGC7_9BACT|nr:hypothetical protein [Mycoplasmopsis edwardii]WBP83744.1 hypothetical protein Me_995_000363 [Mycoplasmopsis edwardii]